VISTHQSSEDASPQSGPRTRGRKPPFLDATTRLRTRFQRDYVRNHGNSRGGKCCVVAAVTPPPDGCGRVAFVISRRYCTKAVTRNRARRLMRETYRRLRPLLKPAWLVLIPRYRMQNAGLADVTEDVVAGCRALGLLAEETHVEMGRA